MVIGIIWQRRNWQCFFKRRFTSSRKYLCGAYKKIGLKDGKSKTASQWKLTA